MSLKTQSHIGSDSVTNKSKIITDLIQKNERKSLVSLLNDSNDNSNISADDQSSKCDVIKKSI